MYADVLFVDDFEDSPVGKIPKKWEHLEFGPGNKEPRFVIENLKVLSSDIISESHIKTILLGMDGSSFKAFAWNAKDTSLENYLYKIKNKKINIAGNIRLNEWRGKKEIQFNIEDISVA